MKEIWCLLTMATLLSLPVMAAELPQKSGKSGPPKEDGAEWAEGAVVRFIRLEHSGAAWDDGMSKETGSADANFLQEFAKVTGFKTADKGESHPIRLLKMYPKDGRPPFVYLTGNGAMGRVSSADSKILREYCLQGGLLIADAGSAAFHRSFTHFIRRVFPDKPLIDIADDDQIYQIPYAFPNGAPAFWHHGGRRAMGIKHEGRWCVFYHPGDMNDAWKSTEFADVSPAMREAAVRLGVNLVYYAYTHCPSALDGDPSVSVPVEAEKQDTVLRAAKMCADSAMRVTKEAKVLAAKNDKASQDKALELEELSRGMYVQAAEYFLLFQKRSPDHRSAGNAILEAGKNYIRAEDHAKGLTALKSVADNEKYDEDLRAQALYWSGTALERMADGGGDLTGALTVYTRLIEKYPTGQWAKYARGRLADPVLVKLKSEQQTGLPPPVTP